jgi:hypothetical protein
MVLLVRIELTASPLPRVCSTTELQQRRESDALRRLSEKRMQALIFRRGLSKQYIAFWSRPGA